jgi:hypothetical protein
MSDLLDINYINSLPHPLFDDGWPVYDIDVQTGLYRINVCGKLSVKHIGDCLIITDAAGRRHHTDDLYTDQDCWLARDALNGEKL